MNKLSFSLFLFNVILSLFVSWLLLMLGNNWHHFVALILVIFAGFWNIDMLAKLIVQAEDEKVKAYYSPKK